MKNKFLLSAIAIFSIAVLMVSCKKTFDTDSTSQTTSIPYIYEKLVNDAYVYGQGSETFQADVPDVVAIAVDTVVGFAGGHGGKTGKDTINVTKSDVVKWPDLTGVGGYSISFQKYNLSGFKTVVSTNCVIAGPIAHWGPTALEGTYKRVSNGKLIQIKKVFDGVYVIDNPGGAGVPPFPYLFYNYDNGAGGDKLVFPIQTNPCGGGLQLVSSTAPDLLTSQEYSDSYGPEIVSGAAVFTMKWKIFEFSSASPSAAQEGVALCQWGLAVRVFEKQ